jgi:hypothetical protein
MSCCLCPVAAVHTKGKEYKEENTWFGLLNLFPQHFPFVCTVKYNREVLHRIMRCKVVCVRVSICINYVRVMLYEFNLYYFFRSVCYCCWEN